MFLLSIKALIVGFIFTFVFIDKGSYFISGVLLSKPLEHCGNNELKDATEDKYHACEHPDIQKGDI